MSTLHTALESLRPKKYHSDVPEDNLESFLRNAFDAASLVANSVPVQPGGTPFEQAKPTGTPNSAKTASEIVASDARPPPVDPGIYREATDSWGKPLKLSAKDNPLKISVYKRAANDKFGAWFGRRSVHEGLGFTKWKHAMQQEFEESLAVQGGPGEGNIRGIGGDRRLVKKTVDGVGNLEVFQLSAQFPGPTAPREFITMLLSTASNMTYETADSTSKYSPRHYMLVSMPVTHSDAPPRNGLVRGQYESVELIREIPLNKPLPDVSTEGKGTSADPEANPVEWIMVTRSDPGGGIPRFMVERGTPSSIVADAGKFLDWACSSDEDVLHEKVTSSSDLNAQNTDGKDSSPVKGTDGADERLSKSETTESLNMTGGHAKYLGPLSKSVDQIEQKQPRESAAPLSPTTSLDSSDSSDDTSSAISFASAMENHRPPARVPSIAYGQLRSSSFRSRRRESSSSDEQPQLQTVQTGKSLGPLLTAAPPGLPDQDKVHFEREMAKISTRKSELQSQLQKAQEAASAVGSSDSKSGEAISKNGNNTNAAAQRDLRKQEDRFRREMVKLDQRQIKETRRAEDRSRKAADKEARASGVRERDEARRKAEALEKENKLLKTQVGSLQRENTMLVAKLGKLEGGPAMLKRLREELSGSDGPPSEVGSSLRARSGSASVSTRSKESRESVVSK